MEFILKKLYFEIIMKKKLNKFVMKKMITGHIHIEKFILELEQCIKKSKLQSFGLNRNHWR